MIENKFYLTSIQDSDEHVRFNTYYLFPKSKMSPELVIDLLDKNFSSNIIDGVMKIENKDGTKYNMHFFFNVKEDGTFSLTKLAEEIK